MSREEVEAKLHEYARINRNRDPLIREALAENISKNKIHTITGISRTTIDRALNKRPHLTQIPYVDLWRIAKDALPETDVDDIIIPNPNIQGPYGGDHIIYLPGDDPDNGRDGFTDEDAEALMAAADERGYEMPAPSDGGMGNDPTGVWWPSVHVIEMT